MALKYYIFDETATEISVFDEGAVLTLKRTLIPVPRRLGMHLKLLWQYALFKNLATIRSAENTEASTNLTKPVDLLCNTPIR